MFITLSILESSQVTSTPVAMWSLIIGTLIIFFIILVLIEATVLQFLGWGSIRKALISALAMNFPSSLLLILLFMIIKQRWTALIISWILAILIEGSILSRIRRNQVRLNFWSAVLANLVSFLLLIVPALFYAR